MPQPFFWPVGEWGGGANIFDVRSYGATPADIGPAVQAAMNKVVSQGNGAVYIPKLLTGGPWRWVTPVTVNVGSAGAFPRLFGDGTWVQSEVDVNSYMLNVVNLAGSIVIEGLLVTGDPNRTTDCIASINFSTCNKVTIRSCAFEGFQSQPGNGVLTFGAVKQLLVQHCSFGACSNPSGNGGTINLQGGDIYTALIQDCDFPDFGNIAGVAYSKVGTTAHVYAKFGFSVEISNCFLDEICQQSVWVDGAGGGVHHVSVRDCNINAPAAAPGNIVHANTAENVRVERCRWAGGFGGSTTAFDITNVTAFDLIDAPQSPPGASTTPTQIVSHAGNGAMRLVDAPGWTLVLTGGGNAYPSSILTIDGVAQPFRVNHAGSPYTLLQSQTNLYADVSGGAITGNIPAANTMPDGWPMELRRTAGSFAVNNVTLTPAAGTIMDPQNPGNAPAASVVISTNGAFRWRAGATENVWELA